MDTLIDFLTTGGIIAGIIWGFLLAYALVAWLAPIFVMLLWAHAREQTRKLELIRKHAKKNDELIELLTQLNATTALMSENSAAQLEHLTYHSSVIEADAAAKRALQD